mmetsp:Transcript_29675/g.83698  ORF Transcript_29675/g.83698 Transcript_29675/m.83698 type:complete len:308 (-) Transcript_29675:197-1120(-)
MGSSCTIWSGSLRWYFRDRFDGVCTVARGTACGVWGAALPAAAGVSACAIAAGTSLAVACGGSSGGGEGFDEGCGKPWAGSVSQRTCSQKFTTSRQSPLCLAICRMRSSSGVRPNACNLAAPCAPAAANCACAILRSCSTVYDSKRSDSQGFGDAGTRIRSSRSTAFAMATTASRGAPGHAGRERRASSALPLPSWWPHCPFDLFTSWSTSSAITTTNRPACASCAAVALARPVIEPARGSFLGRVPVPLLWARASSSTRRRTPEGDFCSRSMQFNSITFVSGLLRRQAMVAARTDWVLPVPGLPEM